METGRGRFIADALTGSAPAQPQKREGRSTRGYLIASALPRYSSREGRLPVASLLSSALPALTHTRGAAVLILPTGDLLPAPQIQKGGAAITTLKTVNTLPPSLFKQRVGRWPLDNRLESANAPEAGVGAIPPPASSQPMFRRLPRTRARHD